MKRTLGSVLVLFLGACTTQSNSSSSSSGGVGSSSAAGNGSSGGAATSLGMSGSRAGTSLATSNPGSASSSPSESGVSSSSAATSLAGSSSAGCGTCPGGYSCGTANGLPVCRAPSGVPLFSHVYVIVMENISLSTLQTAMTGGGAPTLQGLAQTRASGSNYHGVTHPSLPNYFAMTSGDTQGVGCDCKPTPNQGTCGAISCNLVLGACSCNSAATSIADQLEAAGKSWKEFAEDMGTPCNTTDSGHYAVRHVPFLYYDGIRDNATRCAAHVVDLSTFDPASPAAFNFIAPNLVSDMHDPFPAGAQNITNGDTWLGTHVAAITSSTAYQQGGLLVVVWDEDDASGGITGTDDAVGIFVMSPYARSGGYVSSAKANHYSLLATIEDGLGLARLGMAASPGSGVAATLADYFPAQ